MCVTSTHLPDHRLDAEGLLFVLGRPEMHGLALDVWYAIDASDTLISTHGKHTLAGRFGVSAQELAAVWKDSRLSGRTAAQCSRMVNHPITFARERVNVSFPAATAVVTGRSPRVRCAVRLLHTNLPACARTALYREPVTEI